MGFRFQQPPEDEELGPPPGPFQFRPRSRFRVPGGLVRWGGALVLLFVLFIIASILKSIYADWLWFDTVQNASGDDFLSVFRVRVFTRIWLFFAGAGVFLAFFGVNAIVAFRFVSRGQFETPPALGDLELGAMRRVLLVGGIAAALFLAVIFGSQAASQWDSILLLINSQPFGIEDEAFSRDLGFYVFQLPALNFIVGWSLGVVILTTVVVTAIYAGRLLLGGFEDESGRWARPHVSLLLVVVLGLFVWRYWLQRFALVYSERGATFGASWTDINAQVPVIYVLMALGSLTALLLLVSVFRRGLIVLPIGATVLWVVVAIIGGLIYPATVQRFQVEPNELAKEREFIQRNLDATRAAYGLDRIQVEAFNANESVSAAEIDANPETIQNIRLWDHRPLLQTLDQLQTIRPLYDFLNVDVDRYVVNGETRQVMLALRELDPDRLPVDAQSWVNRRLQFTHGFGLAMVPVNEFAGEGLPNFFVKDIPPRGDLDVEQPRIYFGEMPDNYVLVNTDEEEFDFPVGEDRETNIYEGGGGIRLNGFFRKLVYAWELADTNILISDALNDESRLLYRRNIRDRVEEIAPFLLLDSDPYPVLDDDGQIFWFQDAYTHTNAYPYSTRNGGLNYIRNSVKVVINAFDGTTTFYKIGLDDPSVPDDPILEVYSEIYPDLFTDFDEMPDSLRAHLRYPEDLFQTQAQLYLRYHITNPAVFFNREDVWDIPTEVFINQEQPVEPYYVIMKLRPDEPREEFLLILPFRPARKNNAVAWLAARSDGENYGKLVNFRFQSDELVFGPSQVESRIDQNEEISAQITLWNQSGSEVVRGNLLMIPIGSGNLFVEPIYLQATTGRQLPELKRVVVANGNKIAMERTLEEALAVVLLQAPPSTPVVEEGPTPAGTPTGDETPAPTETPGPTAPPADDIDALIVEANEIFERAQALLRDGEFAGYGEEIERLEEVLQQLAALNDNGG